MCGCGWETRGAIGREYFGGRRDQPRRQSVVRSGRELHRRRTRRRTFTVIDQGTMHYQVTINDPNVYTRHWTMAFPLRRNNERGFRLLEEAYHEGERSRSLPLATRSAPV